MTRSARCRGALGSTLLCLALLAAGCSSTHPRRDPVGERFPTVQGSSLDGKLHTIPDEFAGEPVLLLVGYEMESQFDIDRWILGLTQLGIEVALYEVPTIPGLVPGMIAGTIDAGMRTGIPPTDWKAVITIYTDADEVAEFLGNENGLPGRVVLLDAEGRVAFFHDEGFSVAAIRELEAKLVELRGPADGDGEAREPPSAPEASAGGSSDPGAGG